jgi:hypothetical protein
MRKTIWLAAALVAAGPAGGEVARFDKTQATLVVDGRSHDLPLDWRKPATPAPGAPLFLETGKDEALAPLALARGLTVVRVDFDRLPAAARTQALRDLVPKLRQESGAKRFLAHGAGDTGAALAAAGELFDGLLLQDAGAGAARGPRSILVWGSDAYWRGPAPPTAPETAKERRYFLAGLGSAGAPANCAAPPNLRRPDPALRALLVALDDWTKGVKPPGSRVPAAADLTEARALAWPKIPGLPATPAAGLVPKIDADGNEAAGLRLPDQALPIATFTAFNARKEAKDLDPKSPKDPKAADCAAGAALAFPATKAEREKTGDPRLSLMERYGSRAYFVATMRVVADRLVKERLLLPEDAGAYVAAAKQAPF